MATNRDMLSALLDGEADSQMSDPEPASRFMDSPGPHQGFPVRRRPQVQYPPGGFSGLFETTNGLPQAHMRDTVPDWEGAYRDPRPEANLLQSLGMSTSTVPLLSDALSVAGDIQMYKEDPESREWMNYLLTAAGAVPGIPSLAYLMNRGGNAAPNAMRSPGNNQAGAIGYQGSPHKFDALDPSKIGTGEGAQAYGHGAYVAESRDVAQTYQPRDFDAEEIMMARYKEAESAGDYNRMEQWESAMMHDTPDDLRKRSMDMDYDEDYRQAAAEVAEELADIPSASYLYEIDVPDEDIAKMLDWDKPLSEQSWFPKESADDIVARVKAEGRKPTEMEKAVVSIKNGTMADKTGNVWYNDLITKSGEQLMRQGDEARAAVLRMREITGLHNQLNIDIALEQFPEHAEELKGIYAKIGATHTKNRKMPPEMASRLLERAGIPGIKYFDQGSRAAGEGTRNMVLFNALARRAKILKRNDETIAQPSVDEFIGKLLED